MKTLPKLSKGFGLTPLHVADASKTCGSCVKLNINKHNLMKYNPIEREGCNM